MSQMPVMCPGRQIGTPNSGRTSNGGRGQGSGMRRSVGVLVGVLTALTVAGAAAVTATVLPDEGRTGRHLAARPGRAAYPGRGGAADTAAPRGPPRQRARPRPPRAGPPQPATEAASSRQQVGTLTNITKTIGYAGAPRTRRSTTRARPT